MSKSNAFETGLLSLLFTNTNFANVGDATGLRGSTTAGSLYVSLHTADPGEAGSQSTNETSYGSYARVGVVRSGSGWTVTGNSVSPVNPITFAEATSGTPTLTHGGIGTDSSGAGTLLYSGALSVSIVIATGVIPQLKTTSTVTED